MTLDEEDLDELRGLGAGSLKGSTPEEPEDKEDTRLAEALEKLAEVLRNPPAAKAPVVNVSSPTVSPQITVSESVRKPQAWRFQISRDQFGRMEQVLAWPTTIPE